MLALNPRPSTVSATSDPAQTRVFITGTAAFLPGEPMAITIGWRTSSVACRRAARRSAAGRCAGTASAAGTTRWTPDGRWLHSNASMCAAAVRGALDVRRA